MKKLFLISLLIVVVGSLILGGCAKPAPAPAPAPAPTVTVTPAPKEVMTLIHSAFDLEATSQSEMSKWYLNEVVRRSGGLIKIRYNFGGALTSNMETLPAVRSGAVDISNPPPAYFPGDEPIHGLFNATRVPITIDVAMRVILELEHGTGEISQILDAEARANNVKYLIWHPMDYTLITKPKVEKLADIKGLKLRSVGIYEPEVVSSYGAIPANVLHTEWYEAISRGTLDGLICVSSMIVPYKLQEVVKYASFHGGAIASQPLNINLDTWAQLPDEVKVIFEDFDLKKEATEQFIKIWHEYDDNFVKAMKAAGVTFIDVAPAEQEQLWDAYKEVVVRKYPEELAKKGLEAEALKIIDAWLKGCTGEDLKYWDQKFGITR